MKKKNRGTKEKNVKLTGRKKKAKISRIGGKLLGLVAVLIIIALVCILYLAENLKSMGEINERVVNEEVTQIELISEISRDFSYINSQVLNHVINENVDKMSEYEQIINTRIELLNQKAEKFDSMLEAEDERKEIFANFLSDYEKYKKTVAGLLEKSKTNKQTANITVRTNFAIFHDNVEGYMDAMLEISNSQLEAAKQENASRINRIPYIVAMAVVALVVMAIFITVVIYLSVILPIDKVTKQLSEIMLLIDEGRGDLSKRIRVKAKDEMGILADGINAFLEMLQNIISGIMNSCEKLSVMQEKVTSNVTKATDGANSTSSTVEELAAGMQEVSASIALVYEETTQAETAVHKVAKESDSGASYAATIKERAEEVDRSSKETKEQVGQIVREIDHAITDSLAKSKEVDKITGLTNEILSIAHKTNLLALNASIEAARAGEAGKGFAVVADEIRQLADNSKTTANNIQDISIQVVQSVDELSENASKMLEFVNTRVLADYDSLEKTSKQYVTDAETVNDLMYQISHATEHLKAIVEKVREANEGISATISQSAIGITNVAGTTSDLAGEMHQIMEASNGVDQVVTELLKNIEGFK